MAMAVCHEEDSSTASLNADATPTAVAASRGDDRSHAGDANANGGGHLPAGSGGDAGAAGGGAVEDTDVAIDVGNMTAEQLQLYDSLLNGDGASPTSALAGGCSGEDADDDDEDAAAPLGSLSAPMCCRLALVSPDWWHSLITWGCCILPPVAAFAMVVARHSVYVYAPLAAIVFALLYSTVAVVVVEPGIIPRGTGPLPVKNSGPVMWGQTLLLEYDKITKVNGAEVLRRWCGTCRVLRPPRASHCPRCNNCVDVFDHHCSVLGACVGRRNLRYFVAFSYSTVILAVYVTVISAFALFDSREFADTFVDLHMTELGRVLLWITAVYSTLATLICGILAFVYTVNISAGSTLREVEKHDYLFGFQKPSPFRMSCGANCCELLCPSDGRSLVRARSFGTREHPVVVRDPWAERYPVHQR